MKKRNWTLANTAFAALAASVALTSMAEAQIPGRLYDPPRAWTRVLEEQDRPKLDPAQTKLVTELSEAVNAAMLYGSVFDCAARSSDGKCPSLTPLPDLRKQEEAEKFLALSSACLDKAKVATEAKIPFNYPIKFQGRIVTVFTGPMALRDIKHLCSYQKVTAERHLANVKANDIDYSEMADIHNYIKSMNAVGTRMIVWDNSRHCVETNSKHRSCANAHDFTDITVVRRWKSDANECVKSADKLDELKASPEYPVEFLNSHRTLKSPETLGVMSKLCREHKAKADKAEADVTAAAEAAAAKAKADEKAKEDESRRRFELSQDIKGLIPGYKKVIGMGLRLAEGDTKLEEELLGKLKLSGGSANYSSTITLWKAVEIDVEYLDAAMKCEAKAKDMLAKGAPKDHELELEAITIDWKSEFKLPINIEQYGKLCAKVVAGSAAILKKAEAKAKGLVGDAKAEIAAKKAPYLAALQGDRRKIFEERDLYGDDLRGPNGVELRTPEELVKAKAWYIPRVDRSAGRVPEWKTTGWIFNGNTLLRNFSDADFGSNIPYSRAMPDPKDGSPGTMGSGSGKQAEKPAAEKPAAEKPAQETKTASAANASSSGGSSGGGSSGSSAAGSGGSSSASSAGGSGGSSAGSSASGSSGSATAAATSGSGSSSAGSSAGSSASGGTESASGSASGGGSEVARTDSSGGDKPSSAGDSASAGGGLGMLWLLLLGAAFLAVYRFLGLNIKAVEDVLDQMPDARRLMALVPSKAMAAAASGGKAQAD